MSSKSWYFDFGISNHMTNSVVPLFNYRIYAGNIKTTTTNDNFLPIHVVGDLSSFLTDIFVSPVIYTNLLSIGQLVNNNYNVEFSYSGCIVQDQVFEKMITKDLNWDDYFLCAFFPLQLFLIILYFPMHIMLLVLKNKI